MAKNRKTGLGRGLDSLIPKFPDVDEEDDKSSLTLEDMLKETEDDEKTKESNEEKSKPTSSKKTKSTKKPKKKTTKKSTPKKKTDITNDIKENDSKEDEVVEKEDISKLDSSSSNKNNEIQKNAEPIADSEEIPEKNVVTSNMDEIAEIQDTTENSVKTSVDEIKKEIIEKNLESDNLKTNIQEPTTDSDVENSKDTIANIPNETSKKDIVDTHEVDEISNNEKDSVDTSEINEIPDTENIEDIKDNLTEKEKQNIKDVTKIIEKNPRVTLWSARSAAVLRYLRKTEPEFSISKEASNLVEEAVKSKYPEIWALFDDLEKK